MARSFLIILFLLPAWLFGQKRENYGPDFQVSRPLSFITNYPKDMLEYSKLTFRKDNVHSIAGMTVSTLALIIMDQEITNKAKLLGRELNINPNSSQKRYLGQNVELFSQRLYVGFEGPHDLSSALYFIGDGWIHLGISGSFWAYGLVGKNNKAKQVAGALAESIITSGTAVQLVKHITGRESPFVATAPGGKWRFFPNQNEYHRSVPHYDAYPSGHVAATVATITVLSSFYPNNQWIKPVGYSMLTALMFAMLNNGVHWASDYPLGIAMGYSFAKIAVKNNYRVVKKMNE